MRPLSLLLASLALLAAAPVRAQITITAADIRSTFTASQVYRTFDATRTANNNTELGAAEQAKFRAIAQATSGTWDFRGVAYTQTSYTVEEQIPLAQAPAATDPDFSQSNFVLRYRYRSRAGADSLVFSYNTFNDARFNVLGSLSRGEFDASPGPDEIRTKFRPALTSLVFPVAVGSAWTSESEIVLQPDPVPFPRSQRIRWSYTVLGSGTLVTPGGSAPALVLRNRTDITVSVFGQSETTVGFNYIYITKDGRINAVVFTDEAGKVMSASHTVRGAGTTAAAPGADAPALALGVAPNPARGAARLSFELPEAAPVRLAVFDALGREVAVLVDRDLGAGAHETPFDTSALPVGVYVARMRAGAATATRRITVVR